MVSTFEHLTSSIRNIHCLCKCNKKREHLSLNQDSNQDLDSIRQLASKTYWREMLTQYLTRHAHSVNGSLVGMRRK